MIDTEIIRDKNRFKIFRELERDKTLIRMHLLGHQYERLTVVTGIRNQQKTPFFLIDCPRDFKQAVAGLNDCRIRFEFTGTDKVNYVFRTSGKKFLDKEICIRFPEIIERIQRRRHFRLTPPLGTLLYINAKPTIRKMNVIDVSQGGVLGALNKGVPMSEDPLFKIGNNLKDIELIFPAEVETIMVQIKEAVIRRLGKDPLTGRETCAFQFRDIEKYTQKTLLELIYQCQRDLLRTRLPDDA